MKAIILAAGYATRLYPLTENMPKALLKVGGKTILERLFDAFSSEKDIDAIHVVSNSRFASMLCAWAKSVQHKYRQPITVWDDGTSSNETRLGAIGDIRFVMEKAALDDDLFIAASDNLLTEDLSGFFEDFRSHGCDLLLAGKLSDYEERKRYAVVALDENRRVTGLEEKPENPKSDVVAYAEYIYTKTSAKMILEYLSEGGNPDSPGRYPEWLHKRKEVRAYLYPGECVDIGTVKMYTETCEKWNNS